MMIPDPTEQVSEIAKALPLFVAAGDIGEIRVIGKDGGSPFGFYFRHEDIDKAAALAANYSQTAKGVYVVMNRLDPALSDRPQLVKTFTLTKDADIVRRTNLLIDFDPNSPERGPNDSATDAEKEAARLKMVEVDLWLCERGWSAPVVADSGNGFHLLYRLNLPNDDPTRETIKRFLKALSQRFDDDHVGVDISVHNASRITKCYGTATRKGEDRPERPHRQSKLLSVPEGTAVVSAIQIAQATIDALHEADKATADASLFDRPATAPKVNGNLAGFTPTTPKLVLPDVFPVPGRHDTLLKVAGAVRSFGANETEIAEILRVFNRTRCNGGKPDDELQKIARDFSTKDVNLPMRALMECQSDEQVESAERQQKLRHALQHGLKKLAEGHGIAEVAGAINTVLGTLTANSTPQTFETLTSRELNDGAFELDYFVADMLVKSQPCVLAGPKKCLKTNILIDLTLSLASQCKLLGAFYVTKPVRVALVSGESGQATIQETARRVARSKPWINLFDYENAFWCFDLPKLGQPDTAKTIIAYIQKHELDVLVLDPAYLCMPLGESAGNLFLVGVMLADLTKVTAETGCTIILCHHTKKSVTDPFAAPELENISWSGFQEWARQWILLGRREAYDPEAAGSHRLWLSVGGSAGHSGLFALDIEEGSRKDVGGRRWDVSVQTASAAIAEAIEIRQEVKATKAELKATAQIERDSVKLLAAYNRHPDGETGTVIRDQVGMSPQKFGPANVKLLTDEAIEAIDIAKNGRTYPGFRIKTLTRTDPDSTRIIRLSPVQSAHTRTEPPLGGSPVVVMTDSAEMSTATTSEIVRVTADEFEFAVGE